MKAFEIELSYNVFIYLITLLLYFETKEAAVLDMTSYFFSAQVLTPKYRCCAHRHPHEYSCRKTAAYPMAVLTCIWLQKYSFTTYTPIS